MLDNLQIKEFLPHRYPFLLVDRILEIETGHHAIGIKNISGNDFYNNDTDAGSLVFPGALQVEAMAQVAGFVVKDLLDEECQNPLLASIERVRFRRQARPGDQLRIEVVVKKFKGKIGKFEGKTFIGNEMASEATFSCFLVPGDF
ncbi:3-hydroxyacyl-[acyl-carrier-protein] dehydratase [Hydrogenispora ethanolica]|jgi:3-hydroxyacyl-[acyl-carrier-protein] dehydratase|uniref:3-hydroxyacyl-[acyl-carrier-protein] dehydratase n=1 Tax=Hydrogenispora ethanolica TaxID=1082276 RepID=A0A4R1QLA0_HYDET|nr:3-hydroxyacyl-ACP dehydratase FabZ [Hydrogenispora ethanolica]TCL54396.1 3-hydroxyacyl-[acyl-carrier-protein] dehydratase [Hydrogenispora ethanolica]